MAVEHGLGLVVVDGADDLDRLEAHCPGRSPRQDVLVRVIPGVEADTHASVLTGHDGSKFGVSPERARELIRRIEASPSLRMRGLHVHVGSQILQTEPFADAVRGDRGAGRVPGLRPGWRPRRPLHLGRPTAVAWRRTSTPWSTPPERTCPPRPS